MSRTGRLEDIRKVCSHPQAIAQCRNWLADNLPNVPVVDVASTAVAAQIVSEDYTAAAIASELAASMYDLKVVRERIEDQVNNFTRFLVIGKKLADKSGDDKTSLMFSVKDEVGILYRMLEPFSKRGINLAKIESRPLKKKAWEYIFFLDLARAHFRPGCLRGGPGTEGLLSVRKNTRFLSQSKMRRPFPQYLRKSSVLLVRRSNATPPRNPSTALILREIARLRD